MPPTKPPTIAISAQPAAPARALPLPDISAALPWRDWAAGRDEAARRGLPILAVAEAPWTNSAQRLALRLEQDDDLRELATSAVVPMLVDPFARPDLAAAWRWAAMALTGTAGPPLMMMLTPEGLPFLAYCTMNVEGDDTYPSLASLLASLAESYPANADRIDAEARALAEDTGPSAPTADWDALRRQIDPRRGGLAEQPKHPRPMLLWATLDAHAVGSLPDELVAWLRLTLDEIARGGVWDQIDRGFHRCTRNDLWVVPHFEKPVPLNAQLAAVYARAGAELDHEAYRDIAARTASFCMAALQEGVDALGSDTGYYTWTSRELLNTLDAALVQVVTLHYDIKPVHDRQALRRVVEIEQMDRFSHEPVDVLRTRLMRGRAQMRAARARRPAPDVIAVAALAWQAETARWLLRASEWLDSVDVAAAVAALERLLEGRLDPARGYARQAGADEFWLEDQASLLAAFLEAHRATGEPAWVVRARELAEPLCARWWSDGGWLDGPDAVTPSRAVIDEALPATIATLNDALMQLASLVGEPAYAERSAEAAALERSLSARSGHWSGLIPI